MSTPATGHERELPTLVRSRLVARASHLEREFPGGVELALQFPGGVELALRRVGRRWSVASGMGSGALHPADRPLGGTDAPVVVPVRVSGGVLGWWR